MGHAWTELYRLGRCPLVRLILLHLPSSNLNMQATIAIATHVALGLGYRELSYDLKEIKRIFGLPKVLFGNDEPDGNGKSDLRLEAKTGAAGANILLTRDEGIPARAEEIEPTAAYGDSLMRLPPQMTRST
jgi:hypothetical protein